MLAITILALLLAQSGRTSAQAPPWAAWASGSSSNGSSSSFSFPAGFGPPFTLFLNPSPSNQQTSNAYSVYKPGDSLDVAIVSHASGQEVELFAANNTNLGMIQSNLSLGINNFTIALNASLVSSTNPTIPETYYLRAINPANATDTAQSGFFNVSMSGATTTSSSASTTAVPSSISSPFSSSSSSPTNATASAIPATTSSVPSASNNGLSLPAQIGLGVGVGVVALIAIIALLLLLLHRRRRRASLDAESQEEAAKPYPHAGLESYSRAGFYPTDSAAELGSGRSREAGLDEFYGGERVWAVDRKVAVESGGREVCEMEGPTAGVGVEKWAPMGQVHELEGPMVGAEVPAVGTVERKEVMSATARAADEEQGEDDDTDPEKVNGAGV